jgi:hypothetical protein
MEKTRKVLQKYLKIQVENGEITPFCAVLIEKMAIKSIELETNSFSNGKYR